MALRNGQKFYARDTRLNAACGVQPCDRGFITCVADDQVSFYLERRAGYGYIEATCALDVFASNFAADWQLGGLKVEQLADGGYGTQVDVSYTTARLYPKQYPTHFRRDELNDPFSR